MTRPFHLALALLVICLASPGGADVTFLCEVWPATERSRGYRSMAEARFFNGHELRKVYNDNRISYQENYAVVALRGGGVVVLELKATSLGTSDSFGASAFEKLFEVRGEIAAEEVSTGRRWMIRARYPGLSKDSWVDPRLNH